MHITDYCMLSLCICAAMHSNSCYTVIVFIQLLYTPRAQRLLQMMITDTHGTTLMYGAQHYRTHMMILQSHRTQSVLHGALPMP